MYMLLTGDPTTSHEHSLQSFRTVHRFTKECGETARSDGDGAVRKGGAKVAVKVATCGYIRGNVFNTYNTS